MSPPVSPPAAPAPPAPLAPGAADRPGRGIAIMAFAVVTFALNDAATKLLTGSFHPFQVTWARYSGHVLVLLPLAAVLWRRRRLMVARVGLHVARGALMWVSTTFATVAFSLLPLAELAALGFSGPLAATIFAIPLLGEKVGAQRWAAVIAGFLGVLIVLRPGTAAFDPAALLIIFGSCCWGLGVVATRRLGAAEGAAAMLIWTAAVGWIGSTVMVVPVWRAPDLWGWTGLIGMGVFNLLAQYLLIRAVYYAPASTLAPLSYTQLVWSTLLGVLLFDAVPDLWTVVGALVIVASGLYAWQRERERRIP